MNGDLDSGQVSPAEKTVAVWKKGPVKMTPVGNEAKYGKEKWPRADNIFMGK